MREKSNELTAIPVLLERLAVDDGIKGALVTIDAMGCNATIAEAVRDAGADYLLAVKANQPTLLREIELLFEDAEPHELDKAAPISTRDTGASRPEPSPSLAKSTG